MFSDVDRAVIDANLADHTMALCRKEVSVTNIVPGCVSVADSSSCATLTTVSHDGLERARTLESQHHNDTRNKDHLKSKIAKCLEESYVTVNEILQ